MCYEKCAFFTVQWRFSNIQCKCAVTVTMSVCSVQCAECSVHYAVCSVQCAVCSASDSGVLPCSHLHYFPWLIADCPLYYITHLYRWTVWTVHLYSELLLPVQCTCGQCRLYTCTVCYCHLYSAQVDNVDCTPVQCVTVYLNTVLCTLYRWTV